MTHYRSYFEKNNTIIKNSKVNTAKSPTTDIFYGNGFSRYLFKIDLNDLIKKINDGDLVIKDDTKHYLHLTNTVFGDSSLVGQQRLTGKMRATSFDLILFNIPEFWDEGIGYDSEEGSYDFSAGNLTYNEQPSNWYNRTILNNWDVEGIEINEENVIRKIHFDNGNEDIHADITDYINDILTGEKIYHGMGICFDFVYENLNIKSDKSDKSVSFFTKYTQTFFEPYLESVFVNTILDDRPNFVEKIEQKLYLTVNNGDKYVNLDDNPTVDIVDVKNNIIMENLTTENVRKGVYCVKLTIDSDIVDDRTFLKDIWKGIKINGSTLDDVTQRFLPRKLETGFKFNTVIEKTPKITFRTIGLLQNEKIRGGDVRKVSIIFKSIDNIKNVYKEVSYRLFIWEGRTEVNVQDWTLMDSNIENSFLLDTGILIPREYTLEVRVKNGDEIITMNEQINFEIVSQR